MPLESSSQVTPRTNANERRKMEIGQGTRYPVVSHGFLRLAKISLNVARNASPDANRPLTPSCQPCCFGCCLACLSPCCEPGANRAANHVANFVASDAASRRYHLLLTALLAVANHVAKLVLTVLPAGKKLASRVALLACRGGVRTFVTVCGWRSSLACLLGALAAAPGSVAMLAHRRLLSGLR